MALESGGSAAVSAGIAGGGLPPSPGDAERRRWFVHSPSPRPDFPISGPDLAAAIRGGLDRIGREACPGRRGQYRPRSGAARYRPEILGGRGGVELTVHYRPAESVRGPIGGGGGRTAVIWIRAAPADLPAPLEFGFEGSPDGDPSAAP